MRRITAEVAIIGGGLAGCAAAYYLAKRRRPVVVLERDLVGGLSSGVNFGNLRLQGASGPEMPIALRAQALWEGIEAELGESIEFAQQGHLHVALQEDHLPRMARNAAVAAAHGVRLEPLDRAETIRRFPFLSERVLASSWSERDAAVNSRLVTPAFARAALRLGAQVLEGMEVTAVAPRAGGGFTVTAAAGGADALTVDAACLVNAAGAWGGVIAARFGEAVPIFPAGPTEIVTEPVPAFVRPVIHVIDGSILCRQTARGNVLIAGHPRVPVDADTRRTRVPPAKIATNMARLIALVPHLRAHHVIRTWTGIEGYLPDMMPAFGPSGTTPGLFHAFAFSGHGLQLAPAVGAILAELIAEGGTQAPIAPFALGRFAAGGGAAVSTMAEEFAAEIRNAPGSSASAPPTAHAIPASRA